MPLLYIVDASIVVKWMHEKGEEAIERADALLAGALERRYALMSSDVVTHEVFNALIRGKGLRGKILEEAVASFFVLPLTLIHADRDLVAVAVTIAEEYAMTFYDAIYVAIAYQRRVPLITANIRHQGRASRVTVIDMAQWGKEHWHHAL